MSFHGRKRRSQWLRWALASLLLIAYSLVLLTLPRLGSRPSLDPFLTYTPAKEAIKYQVTKFDGSLGLRTKYTGPPRPETEDAWGALFKHYNIRFTADEIRKLNRSEDPKPIELREGGGYFGQLSAYHHLHCLKMLRLVVWHDAYNVSINDLRGHADHCIDDIRQAIMCQPDLSVVTFWWHPQKRKPMANFHLDQTCVDWGKLDEWAAKRSFSIFDQKTLVHPTLGISFPMVNGEIEVHENPDLPPVWPEDASEHAAGHGEHKAEQPQYHGDHKDHSW
ncbi:hypothetical protein N656DRAFT_833177 [Canariomyces notabilis]|uniref:Uncharacterized protein n=1 Tax=Canariomyces notabilis TaxID=2074819 RepID=A0AAN6T7U9_9PEZI|nr:hypothetical protein N656DRAFT_833177 [Canariomyces arenarius]